MTDFVHLTPHTAEGAAPRALRSALYLHADLLSDDAHNLLTHSDHSHQLKKRAALLLTQLGAYGNASFKSVAGVNAGWRRSPLGGNGGMQYYLWWAKHSAPPVKGLGFPAGAIVVRAAREHDDTSKPIAAGALEDYRCFSLAHAAEEAAAEAPWTEAQLAFIQGGEPIRLLRGQPGSGKTTSLWRAVEVSGARRVLYLTWSAALATRASAYFGVMAPVGCAVEAMSLDALWEELVSGSGRAPSGVDAVEGYKSAVRAAVGDHRLRARLVESAELYAGLTRAWLVGRAPWGARRVWGEEEESAEEREEREALGAWGGVIEGALGEARRAWGQVLARRPEALAELFPDLARAQAALEALGAREARRALAAYDLVVVDEVQDLTPLEVEALARLCERLCEREGEGAPRLLLAGDEGQVVRPTYFEWAELSRHLRRLARPSRVVLRHNLRSPRAIGEVLSRVGYGHLPAELRPRGQAAVEIDNDAAAWVGWCAFEGAGEGEGEGAAAWVSELLEGAAETSLAFVYLGAEPPAWLAGPLAGDALRDRLYTPRDVKGLEFDHVCLLGAAGALARLTPERAEEDPLAYMLEVNHLRVALSRATQTLVCLEVAGADLAALEELLGAPAASPEGVREELLGVERTLADRCFGLLAEAERASSRRRPAAWRALLQAWRLSREEGLGDDSFDADWGEQAARLALEGALDGEEAPAAARGGLEGLGWRALLGLCDALAAWSAAPSGARAERLFQRLLDVPAVGRPWWLTPVLRERRPALLGALADLAGAKTYARALRLNLPEQLALIGVGAEELPARALELRRAALETLMGAERHSEAAQVWSAVSPEAPEDHLRGARLARARRRWAEAARAYEGAGALDEAFEMWREAGERAEVERLRRSVQERLAASRGVVELALDALQERGLREEERAELLSRLDGELSAARTALRGERERLAGEEAALRGWRDDIEVERLGVDEELARLARSQEELRGREGALAGAREELRRREEALVAREGALRAEGERLLAEEARRREAEARLEEER
ncbi:MAG: hypothetical protein FJ138_13385, partial [Deltaproteobacteria bacterium]|nr:hypothetical protein [Deltaproteobacteria bacterium]